MNRLTLLASLFLAGCSTSGLDAQPYRTASDSGRVIDGEFIIDADLDFETVSDLALTKVDFNSALGFGLYRANDEGLTQSALEAVLKDHIKDAIGKWKYPRWIEVVDDLPKTATGKIQRFKLRDER